MEWKGENQREMQWRLKGALTWVDGGCLDWIFMSCYRAGRSTVDMLKLPLQHHHTTPLSQA